MMRRAQHQRHLAAAALARPFHCIDRPHRIPSCAAGDAGKTSRVDKMDHEVRLLRVVCLQRPVEATVQQGSSGSRLAVSCSENPQ